MNTKKNKILQLTKYVFISLLNRMVKLKMFEHQKHFAQNDHLLLFRCKYKYVHLYQVYKHRVNQYVEMINEDVEEYVIHHHHLELLDSKKSIIMKTKQRTSNNQSKRYEHLPMNFPISH
jgi:hypothetical protein